MNMMVEAYRPPDEKWQAMRDAYNACVSAGVPVPPEVVRFFGDSGAPDDRGIVVRLKWLDRGDPLAHGDERLHPAVAKDPKRWGYAIEIAKLPEHVTHVMVWAG